MLSVANVFAVYELYSALDEVDLVVVGVFRLKVLRHFTRQARLAFGDVLLQSFPCLLRQQQAHVVAERVAPNVPARAFHSRRQISVDYLRVAAALVGHTGREPDKARRQQDATGNRRRTVVRLILAVRCRLRHRRSWLHPQTISNVTHKQILINYYYFMIIINCTFI